MDSLRLFIAVDTPAAVKAQMALLRDDLARRARNVRWEATGKFHCTLRFLGSVDRSRLGSIVEQVERAASEIPPFSIVYSGIGFFPDNVHPRILWVGIRQQSGDLSRLEKSISAGLSRIGFVPEERAFHPHVTLGRVGSGRPARGLIEIGETRTFDHPPVIVPAVEIMQSVPGPRGSEYIVLRSIPLTGAGGVSPGPPGSS